MPSARLSLLRLSCPRACARAFMLAARGALGAPSDALPPMVPDLETEAHPGATETSWYGWQPLLIDTVSTALGVGEGLLLVKASSGDPSFSPAGTALLLAPGVLGGLGYLFGGPTVHWLHARVGTGFLSLGLRVGLPLAGLGLGALIPGIAGRENLAGALVGTAVGMGTAMVVDDAFLAKETVPTVPRTIPSPSFSLLPTVDRAHHGAGLRLGGAF